MEKHLLYFVCLPHSPSLSLSDQEKVSDSLMTYICTEKIRYDQFPHIALFLHREVFLFSALSTEGLQWESPLCMPWSWQELIRQDHISMKVLNFSSVRTNMSVCRGHGIFPNVSSSTEHRKILEHFGFLWNLSTLVEELKRGWDFSLALSENLVHQKQSFLTGMKTEWSWVMAQKWILCRWCRVLEVRQRDAYFDFLKNAQDHLSIY